MGARTIAAVLVGLCALGVLWAVQLPFREYPGWEYNDFPLPTDYQDPAEWVFARLMYPSVLFSDRPYTPYWQRGGTNWTIDYPRSDRHLSQAVRRLTRVNARSVEQPVNLDDDNDVFHWPWLYAVEPGHWDLTDEQAAKLREYLLRGGFFMVDDFHGSEEWDVFIRSMSRVFPDRPIVDIENADPIFHSMFNLDDRIQVPGAQFLETGRIAEKDGYDAHWRGIYDDRGRIMVAICHNMDLGDSWEHADDPLYPEKYTALGTQIAINYIIYSMTH